MRTVPAISTRASLAGIGGWPACRALRADMSPRGTHSMMSTNGGAFVRLVAGGAAAATALGWLHDRAGSAGPRRRHVSGSLIDAAGNYVDGYVYASTPRQARTVGYDYAESARVSTPGPHRLEDGHLQARVRHEHGSYARRVLPRQDHLATADVVTVAGAAQTLAPVDHRRAPERHRPGRLAPSASPVEDATVQVVRRRRRHLPSGYAYDRGADGIVARAGRRAGLLQRLRPRHRRPARDRVLQRQGRPWRRPTPCGAGANLGQVTVSKGSSSRAARTSPAASPARPGPSTEPGVRRRSAAT